MVTGARPRWGRGKGGSTCRYWRLGRILTSHPCCGAMVWAGRGLSGLGPIEGRGRGEPGGGSERWRGSRGQGALETRWQAERAVREGDTGGGWRVLKQGGKRSGRISEMGRRNWRWGGDILRGGLWERGRRVEEWETL